MRTTVTLQDDVAAAIEEIRRREGTGTSEVINRLLRQGLTRGETSHAYVHRSFPMGLKVDVSNVGEVLDLLDGD